MQDIPYITLQEAAEGNKQAFEQIYNMASGFVYTVAYRVVNDVKKPAM